MHGIKKVKLVPGRTLYPCPSSWTSLEAKFLSFHTCTRSFARANDAVGMRNAILRNHLNWSQIVIFLVNNNPAGGMWTFFFNCTGHPFFSLLFTLHFFSLRQIKLNCNVVTLRILCKSSFLTYFSINLLAFYHECRSLIGYATHVLFKVPLWWKSHLFYQSHF